MSTSGAVLDVPEDYSSIYSILASQSIEVGRIMIKRSKQYLSKLLNSNDLGILPKDVPDYVRSHLNDAKVGKSIELLDTAEKKWAKAVERTIKTTHLERKLD